MEGDSVSADSEGSKEVVGLLPKEPSTPPGKKSWKESLEIGETEGDSWQQGVFKILFPLALPFIATAILLIYYPWEGNQNWLG